jgi:hypothetical protein
MPRESRDRRPTNASPNGYELGRTMEAGNLNGLTEWVGISPRTPCVGTSISLWHDDFVPVQGSRVLKGEMVGEHACRSGADNSAATA